MGPMPPSAAAELAVEGSTRLAAGLDDCEARIELGEWVTENLHNDEKLREARKIARALGGDVYPYFMRAVRLAAGTADVCTQGVKEYVQLIAMPFFYSGEPRPDGLRTTDWGGRQLVERYLESAMGLRMLSVRLAPFPVESVALAELTPAQQQRLLKDLLNYGESRVIAPPELTFDGEENGLIWAGIIRYRVDSYVEEFNRFKSGVKSEKIAKFRTFAARELARGLTPLALMPSVTVYPPSQFADGFPSYRLLQLSRVSRKLLERTPKAHALEYRLRAGRLTLRFHRGEMCAPEAAEFDCSDVKPSQVLDALRYLQKGAEVELREGPHTRVLTSPTPHA